MCIVWPIASAVTRIIRIVGVAADTRVIVLTACDDCIFLSMNQFHGAALARNIKLDRAVNKAFVRLAAGTAVRLTLRAERYVHHECHPFVRVVAHAAA